MEALFARVRWKKRTLFEREEEVEQVMEDDDGSISGPKLVTTSK
jgi:hypothetical protein